VEYIEEGKNVGKKYIPLFLKNFPFFKALDISADLVEIGRCPIAVVCAGVKSILDIGRTLEFLVCFLGYNFL